MPLCLDRGNTGTKIWQFSKIRILNLRNTLIIFRKPIDTDANVCQMADRSNAEATKDFNNMEYTAFILTSYQTNRQNLKLRDTGKKEEGSAP